MGDNHHTNKVELIGYYGGDTTHALSAWTSTNRTLTEEKKQKIPALFERLLEGSDGNIHTSPFEKSSLHFLTTVEIASHIHMLKHRIAVSINGESSRYKEMKDDDKYYIPDDFPDEWKEKLESHTREGIRLYHECLASLVESGLTRKRAKESSRFFRTYNTQLDTDIMFNFLSFVKFLKLRKAGSAQDEIHDIAEKMLELVRATEAFTESLRVWGF